MTLRRLVAGDSSTASDGFLTAPISTVLGVLVRFLGVAACTTAVTAVLGSLARVVGGMSTVEG